LQERGGANDPTSNLLKPIVELVPIVPFFKVLFKLGIFLLVGFGIISVFLYAVFFDCSDYTNYCSIASVIFFIAF
jgi:hypothetical protein